MLKLTPLSGLEDVKFGDTCEEVKSVYGPPEEEEVDTSDEQKVFDYYKKGLAFFFSLESGLLEKIEINEVELTIWGVQLMFEKSEVVRNVIEQNTTLQIELVEDQTKASFFYCIKELGLDLCFEKGKLVTVTAIDEESAKNWAELAKVE